MTVKEIALIRPRVMRADGVETIRSYGGWTPDGSEHHAEQGQPATRTAAATGGARRLYARVPEVHCGWKHRYCISGHRAVTPKGLLAGPGRGADVVSRSWAGAPSGVAGGHEG